MRQVTHQSTKGITLKRRSFLKHSSVGVAAGAIAHSSVSNAQAVDTPEIKWRLAASWPKNLDVLWGGVELLAKRVAELTHNKFQIRAFAAGEIVPGLQVLDAVQAGTVEMGHTAGNYYIGKDIAFGLAADIPFGMNVRQKNAWWYSGGGAESCTELFKAYGCIPLAAGNCCAQMGGWYRKEINSVADLKGLKFRIAGIAGQVLTKLGVVPQQLAASDIYPALEKGSLDAAEWIGPHDDEKLGLNKVAPYYYYPSWWEGSTMLHTIINEKKWLELPPQYRAALETACIEVNTRIVADYDAKNPAALRRLVANGTKLKPFSKDILQECEKISFQLYAEFSEKSPHWKRMYPQWKKFRDEEYLWFRFAEYSFDSYTLNSKISSDNR